MPQQIRRAFIVLAVATASLFAQGTATDQLILQYSSYFGGAAAESITAVVVGVDGYVYIAGTTRSKDFPVTPGAFQTQYGADSGFGGHAFISKLDPNTMALEYSTYLGGSSDESVVGLAVDATGSAYIDPTLCSRPISGELARTAPLALPSRPTARSGWSAPPAAGFPQLPTPCLRRLFHMNGTALSRS